MKISTKTGDKEETSLFGGRRVSKASNLIELVGELDELQAVIGWCGVVAGRRLGGEGADGVDLRINRLGGLPREAAADRRVAGGGAWDHGKSSVGTENCQADCMTKIVDDLYRMMSIVGFEMKCPKNIKPIGEEDVEFLEKEMAGYEEAVGDLGKFVRPGGSSELSARLHIARTVCRRVERRMVETLGVLVQNYRSKSVPGGDAQNEAPPCQGGYRGVPGNEIEEGNVEKAGADAFARNMLK